MKVIGVALLWIVAPVILVGIGYLLGWLQNLRERRRAFGQGMALGRRPGASRRIERRLERLKKKGGE